MEYDVAAEEPLSMAVVRAVSTVAGTDPCSLPPLGELLDPDALDALFEPLAGESPQTGGHISFVYAAHRVAIDNGEYLTVSSLDPSTRDGRDLDGSSPS